MSRPRLLDLFCGAGGCSVGYSRAGFDVVGVDIKPQPHYPFEFHQAEVFGFLDDLAQGPPPGGWRLGPFAAIHASPPCHAHSVLRRANLGAVYVDLIPATRERLAASGLPYVIENVPGAPLRDPLVLCGSMFDELQAWSGDGSRIAREIRQLRRHRLFESNVELRVPRPCAHKGEALGVYGGGAVGRYTFANGCKVRNGRRGGYQGTIVERREAMGIDWMNSAEINQAIPPAYTEHIGHYLMAEINARAAA